MSAQRWLATAVMSFAAMLLLPQCAGGNASSADATETASSAPATPDPLDAKILARMKRGNIPGLSLAVVRKGQIVKLQGYGLADVKKRTPTTGQTIYQTGSVGKQFTAMAVMMLVEQGKIGLDDPITKYLGTPNPAWRKITVRRLLTHTSGIAVDALDDADMTKSSTYAEMLSGIADAPLDFTPGKKWKYSNNGYVLLGFIVQKASGQFYGDFLREHVWVPLGMTSTQIIDESAHLPRLANGYEFDHGKLHDQEYVAPIWNTTADGSMYSTAEDLAKWAIALDEGRFLTPQSYREMYTPVRLNDGSTYPYGFGWNIDDDDTGRVYDHDGTWQGYTAYVTRHLDAGVDVTVMSNLGGSDEVDDIGDYVAKAFIERK